MTDTKTEIVKLTLDGDDKPTFLRVRSSDARTGEKMRRLRSDLAGSG